MRWLWRAGRSAVLFVGFLVLAVLVTLLGQDP